MHGAGSAIVEMAHTSPLKLQKSPTDGFIGIFVLSFAVLFLFALIAQLLTLKWRPWLPGAEGDKSLIHDVKSAVYTFMSYLN